MIHLMNMIYLVNKIEHLQEYFLKFNEDLLISVERQEPISNKITRFRGIGNR